jgi:D-glycero-D-manno-heptose 1,7-bisphosphate phosphatase
VKRAVFFDRDGTLIESVHYLRRWRDVRLLPGVARAVRRIRDLGYVCIGVTNQAAVAKGLMKPDDLVEIHARLDRLLGEEGGEMLTWYHAAIAQRGADRERVEHVYRKPGPGMLLRAAREHDIDLGASYMVGDAVTDTLAGRNAGCGVTILVRTGLYRAADEYHRSVDHVVDSVADLPPLLEALRCAAAH